MVERRDERRREEVERVKAKYGLQDVEEVD